MVVVVVFVACQKKDAKNLRNYYCLPCVALAYLLASSPNWEWKYF